MINLKFKAAALLGKLPSQIVSVTEHAKGATVQCRNGNRLQIPLNVWIGEEFD